MQEGGRGMEEEKDLNNAYIESFIQELSYGRQETIKMLQAN